MIPRRPRALAWILVAAGAASGTARADDKQACVDDHEQGQIARRGGRLIEARSLFVRCAQPACPGVLQEECSVWLAEVDAELPSIVVDVRDADGRARTDATLWIDGRQLGADAAGRATPLDPGTHSVRARLADGRSIDRAVVVRAGEKMQPVRVEVPLGPAALRPDARPPPPSAPRPAPDERSGPPPLTYVLGGVALAALGAFATFAIVGSGQERTLQDECGGKGGECTAAQIDARYDPMQRSYAVADITLAIGIAAFAGAGLVWAIP